MSGELSRRALFGLGAGAAVAAYFPAFAQGAANVTVVTPDMTVPLRHGDVITFSGGRQEYVITAVADGRFIYRGENGVWEADL